MSFGAETFGAVLKSQVLLAIVTIVYHGSGIPFSEYFHSTDNHQAKPMELRKEDDQHEERAFTRRRENCLQHS